MSMILRAVHTLKCVFSFLMISHIISLNAYSGEQVEENNGPVIQHNWKERLKTSLTPMIVRPLITFPFEIPTILKQIQDQDYRTILKHFVSNKNPHLSKAFYLHFFLSSLKSSYSYPVAAVLPYFLPRTFTDNHPIIYRALLSLTISSIDAVVSPPLEAIKVGCIYEKPSFKLMFNRTTSSLTFQSNFTNMMLFFCLNDYLRNKLQNEHPGIPLVRSEYLFIGACLATIQTTAVYPFLTLRTRLQTDHIKINNTPASLRSYLKYLYQTNQLGGLYNGWRARVFRMFVIATFDSYWLTQIEGASRK